jgi:hypothetical protein
VTLPQVLILLSENRRKKLQTGGMGKGRKEKREGRRGKRKEKG